MKERPKVMIVDDDEDIREVLCLLLEKNYETLSVPTGVQALELLQKQSGVDLVILDVMMPEMDGFEVCGRLREFSNAPVLFLTAKTAESDKISAYRAGGDDFLSKPFSREELLMKTSALIRRYKEYRGKPESVQVVDRLEFDRAGHSVRRDGEPLALTDTEFSLLEYLMSRRGETVSSGELYENVWKERFLPASNNTVMVHLLNLRRKIETDPSNPTIIRTVWGKGYRID